MKQARLKRVVGWLLSITRVRTVRNIAFIIMLYNVLRKACLSVSYINTRHHTPVKQLGRIPENRSLLQVADVCFDRAPTLHWGPCAYMLVYQMGIAASLLDMGESAMGVLRACRITGVSAGAATAGYMFASLRGIGTMDYWYYNHVRQVSHPVRPFRELSHLIWMLSMSYHDICTSHGLSFSDGAYGLYTADVWGKKVYRDRFQSSHHFAEDLCAGGFIPFITAPGVAYAHRDGYQLDGAWDSDRPEADVYVPSVPNDLRHHKFKLVKKMLAIARDSNVADEMYEMGKLWGRNNGEGIIAKLRGCNSLLEISA